METIAALELKDEDAAAVRLAHRYAAAIDAVTDLDLLGKVLADLGPKLHAVLESLGATPAARARLKGGAPESGGGKLAHLRSVRKAVG